MEFTMSKSKMVIGVALVAIGLGVAFEETIQTRMYTYMHSSMHDRHSANGMGHDIKICQASEVLMRRKLNLMSLL